MVGITRATPEYTPQQGLFRFRCKCGTEYVALGNLPRYCPTGNIPMACIGPYEYDPAAYVHNAQTELPVLLMTGCEAKVWDIFTNCFWAGCSGRMIRQGNGHGCCIECNGGFRLAPALGW